MLEFALSVFFVMATAVVYTEVLTNPGMLLDWWCRLLHNHIKQEWLLKPLVDCVYCFGGQLALWSYPVIFWGGYSVLFHLLFIITVIFTIHIYKLIWN